MKVAAVHCTSYKNDLKLNFLEIEKYLYILDKENVDFALFPELGLSGYTKNIDILNTIIKKGQTYIEKLRELSSMLNISFAIGFPVNENEKFFISQYIFSKGEIIGIHIKTHLGPSEETTYSPSEEINIFEINNKSIAIQLCFESHFPELTYIQENKGANFIFYAFASPRENIDEKFNRLESILKTRAYDNSCFVIACNITGEYSVNKKYAGIAMIISPKGKTISKSSSYNSGYCTAYCDIEEITKIKNSNMAFFNKHKRTDFITNYYINTQNDN